jgi:hypothetical protein
MNRSNSRRSLIVSVVVSMLVFGFGAVTAQASPVSSCTAGIDADHYSCNFYPTNSLGNIATDTGLISAPTGTNPIGAGYIVFLQSGVIDNPADEQTPSDWAEVLWVVGDLFSGAESNEFELFTGSAMPSYNTVNTYNGGGDDEFLVQNPNGIYTLTPTNHSYVVFTIAATPTSVPEPTTVGFTLFGVIGLVVVRARSVRRRLLWRSGV